MSSPKLLQNGRYDVLKKLGEGGKGIVYKARDTVLNRVVAIKMLKSAVLSEEAYSRFIREAQAVAKLNHPNVVSIYDIGKEDEKHFFVLEFIDGMSIRGLMGTYPEGKCDIQTVLRTGIDICESLRYAHSQGVLHRDIKPGNILINQGGVAKLMDFGLATMLGQPRITKEGIIVGTVAYVAPEIALGKGADARSDLYSLGSVLYEMVTGKPPFPGEDPVKIIFGHVHDYPVSPGRLNPKVPQALAECIMKLLEKDPEKRYQTAADLLKALKDVAEDFSREVVVPGPRPTAVKEVQLVDRAEEMGLLREPVDRAVRGEGGVVFLCGEAGIGKTRLARELRAYARLRGMQVLSGKCPASFRVDGVPPPFVLWKEVIKDYLEVCTPEQLRRVIGFYPSEVSKLVPELRQKLEAIPPSVPISPEHERDRLFEAVTQFITNISKETPLLIVLDDLQWTDQSSLLLLHYLARSVCREPLLLLGAYRDTYVDEGHPLSFVLTELKRERLLQSVPLKRMSFDDLSEMIRRILGQDDVPREFCEMIYEKTRGNPYFVEEMIESLKEEEVLYCEEDKWRIKEVSRVKFPKTVKGVITQRIARLDDECQNVLTMASFVGKDFTFESLIGVTDVDEDKVLEIMERILKTGLVRERVIRGEDVYSFADVMVRDVLHEEPSRLRHKRLHGVVGRALEKVHAEKIDEHLGELAYHFLESGDKETALDYFLKAGDRAMKMHANEEASSYFEAALNLLDKTGGDVREKARVAEALGDLKNWNMEFEPSIEYFDKALELLKETGDKRGEARLYEKKAEILTEALGRCEDGLAQLSVALKILARTREPESLELAWVYYEMAHLHLGFLGNLSEALFWGRRALGLAEKLGALEVKAKCYIDLLFTELVDLQKAAKYAEEGLRIALENNYAATAAYGYLSVPVYLVALGEFQRAIELWEEALEFARKVGCMTWSGLTMGTLTWVYALAGDLQKATETAEEAIHTRKKIGFLQVGFALPALALAYQTIGEWDKAYEYYVQALDFAERMHHHYMLIQTKLGLGRLFYEKEEYGKSEEILLETVEIVEKIRGKIHCPAQISHAGFVPYIWLSELHIRMGKFKEAKDMADEAYEVAVESKSRFYVAMANRLRGMLFGYQKDWESAIESFEKSKREFEAMGALPDLITTLYEYGLTCLRRNQEGDREKAHSLLDQALEISQKIGAKKWIEKMIAKKKLLTA